MNDLSVNNKSLKFNILTGFALCPLTGALVFQLKKRPPDFPGRKGRKVDDKGLRGKDSGSSSSLPPEKLPYLVELSPGKTPDTHKCTHTATPL